MKQNLKNIQNRLKSEIKLYRMVMEDSRTPRRTRWLLGLALGYLALLFDLILDFIPVLGALDDAVIVPGLIYVALKQVPDEVMAECRKKVRQEDNDRPSK